MPELPEVETIRRDLEPHLLGNRVTALWTSGKSLRLKRPVDDSRIRNLALGRCIDGIRRVAKYLLLDLEGGGVLVFHLGMSGRMQLAGADTLRALHAHVALALDSGTELRFVDPRRFGLVVPTTRGEVLSLPELASLGVDPLGPELTAERLHDMTKRARCPVKAFLLDQSRVAGIGNIYACEALFEAKIHPMTPADRLSMRRVARLREAIVLVLQRGITNRGTTLRDYVDGQGVQGNNQHSLRVYGREAQACPREDGGQVRRAVTSGRSTYYCTSCQK
ncbi:MAG: bifunctional DNA-formamidopyrimidine glycosylase/DNA-(apurinic or apyrimidinic site) lyase [Deltaproteobacteria bacterium]|nr:bifunctional DNA-formamidopyrimidine glycosylase/DNA-(apurinic or apyrimidinic site) lyase [Deltaproteobacteria bacterium]